VLKRSQRHLIGLALILLSMLACGLAQGTPTAQSTLPTQPPPPELSTESAAYLILPGNIPVSLPVVKCSGTGAGSYFDLRAVTGPALNPNHAEMLVAGINNGAGTYDNMYVSINLGPTDKWSFSGSTLIAQVQLDADGSGSFKDVLITNADGNSDKYAAGEAYPFSAKWTCKYTQ